MYLLSDSDAKLDNVGAVLQARLRRGTVGFSSLIDRQFVILAPEGEVRAAYGKPAYGQVTITGPNDIVISAYTGALVLHRADQTLIVNAGQSYYVSLVPEEASAQTKRDGPKCRLIWRLILIGTAAGVGYWLWRIKTESPVDP